ncbi:hypothetical protein CHUAL_002808 [Chamberlinius hualienensis]
MAKSMTVSKESNEIEPVATPSGLSPSCLSSKNGIQPDEDGNKKKGKVGKKKVYGGRYKPGGDMLTQAAVDNANYVCHNVQDCLYIRGFRWEDGGSSKKSRRKR